MNKDIKLLIENIFQRKNARELLKRSKAEELDAQIRKMYLYHPKYTNELADNIIECLENKTDLNLIDVSEIDYFEGLFSCNSWLYDKIDIYIQNNKITSIDISGWYIRSDANIEHMFEKSTLEEIVLPNNLQKIDNYMFYESSLTSVTIPNSVTSIGNEAFYNCSLLTSVNIPDSVTSIGKSAFDGCSGLTSITIPDSVTKIGNNAFSYCTGLTSVTIPNSVTKIDYMAFSHCTGLTSVTIPDSVKSIDNWAFAVCSGLTSVTIPNSVTSIGNEAFYGCKSLSSVTIPVSVTSIGEWAFYGCSGLTSITIPDSVNSIGEAAFTDCPNLTIYVNNVANFKRKFNNYRNFCKANQIKSIRNKPINENIFQRESARELLKRSKAEELDAQIRKMYLYHPTTKNELKDNIIECFENETDLNLIDVSKIDDFYQLFVHNEYNIYSYSKIAKCIKRKEITNIDISGWYINPDANVDGMFFNSILQKVVLPDSLTIIGNGMFCNSNLISITIPNKVITIGDDAFSWCSGLKSVTIGNSVKSIGSRAFEGCYYLPSVTIPDKVTSIGEMAFRGCGGLTSVTIPNLVTIIDIGTFIDCEKLTSVTIPNSVTRIDAEAFKGCKELTIITIPDSVKWIGAQSFYGCTDLTSINIPESVEIIGQSAFTNCPKLTIYVNDVNEFKRKFKYKRICNMKRIKPIISEKPINENIFQRDDVIELLKKLNRKNLMFRLENKRTL